MTPRNLSSLQDKVFVVTGARSGMGLATATTLLEQGAFLGLCDITESSLTELVKTLNENQKKRVITQGVDITKRSDVASFLNSAKARFGRLDGIANLAGTAGHRLGHEEIWQVEDSEYDFVMGVNVCGAFNILAEGMKPGLLNESGSIVHTGSMFSERGFAKGAVYSASKHAGIGLVKSAAIEGGPRGIRVNMITPGPIDTPMLRANEESGAEGTAPDVPLMRLGKAQECADIVAILLSDQTAYVTGAVWSVDGGANA
ncbi:hypothetical protein Q7P37_001456 [Cladosporium fusiforme]